MLEVVDLGEPHVPQGSSELILLLFTSSVLFLVLKTQILLALVTVLTSHYLKVSNPAIEEPELSLKNTSGVFFVYFYRGTISLSRRRSAWKTLHLAFSSKEKANTAVLAFLLVEVYSRCKKLFPYP